MSIFKVTQKNNRRFCAALIAGFLGGNIASIVKFGCQFVLPPRPANGGKPVLELLNNLGLHTEKYVYTFSGAIKNYAAFSVHHLFSIFFAMLYAYLVEIFPVVKIWQGMLLAVGITIGFHGIALPVLGLSPPIWAISHQEFIAELFGHILWAWTIEIFRRDIRNRITKESDAF